jgi:hypothetical protein
MRKSKGCFKMGVPMLTKMVKNGAPKATHTMPDGTVMPGTTHGEKTSPLGCYKNYKRKPGTKEFSKGSCTPK